MQKNLPCVVNGVSTYNVQCCPKNYTKCDDYCNGSTNTSYNPKHHWVAVKGWINGVQHIQLPATKGCQLNNSKTGKPEVTNQFYCEVDDRCNSNGIWSRKGAGSWGCNCNQGWSGEYCDVHYQNTL